MNGVNILNEVTRMPDKAGTMVCMYVIFAIGLLVIAGVLIHALCDIIGSIYMEWKDWVGFAIMCLFIGGCLFGAVMLGLAIPGEANKLETIVYATIDDSVPWTEINKRYELIRQDGKIYQLRVREDGDV